MFLQMLQVQYACCQDYQMKPAQSKLTLRGDYNTKVHTPGKGNRPICIFRDKYLEKLAYPGIFLGQKRPDNVDR